MKKLLFLLLLIPLSLAASDSWARFSPIQPDDQWISADKWSHYSFSVIMTAHNYYYLKEFTDFSRQKNQNLAIGISLSMGLSKEILDFQKRKSLFSWKDLVFDVAGTMTGLLLLNYME